MIPPQTTDGDWSEYGAVHLEGVLNESDYLCPGWKRANSEPLPTFTTSRPREFSGRRPAGLDKLNAVERKEWEDDWYRFPPYQYRHGSLLWKGDARRLPNPDEREVIMGFPKQYTVHCLPKSQQGTQEHVDLRNTLLGNSWNVTVIVWLVSQLCSPLGLCNSLSVQDCISRTAPGCQVSLASFLARPLMRTASRPVPPQNELLLVRKLMNMVSIKGEDILLSAPSEETLRYHRLRASVPSNLWKLRTICGWQWKGNKEHINVLELRAVYCAPKWKILKQNVTRHRLVHLTDSLVCLHCLSRGRTSSRKLRRTLARINALLLLSGNTAVWTYVHTALNPADAPSRRKVKKKWAKK